MSSTAPNVYDDESVAKLLAEDARQTSLRYASTGSYALTPKRPASGALKPNTRFLRTLVREADSHNAALKRKEELEARVRLRRLRDAEKSERYGRSAASSERPEQRHRHRHHTERNRGRYARDSCDEEDESRIRHGRPKKEKGHRRSRSPERETSRHEEPRRRVKRRHSDDHSGDETQRSRSNAYVSSRRSSSQSRPWDRLREEEDKSAADGKRRSSHQKSTATAEKQSLVINEVAQESRNPGPRSRSVSSTSSDPLSPLIGPHQHDATMRERGRGFNHSIRRSNIDAHFSSQYDPSLDVDVEEHLDSALEGGDMGDDWDNALEALRDRRSWHIKQAERMREAGFDEVAIKRWEAGSRQRRKGDESLDLDIRDVKWRKKGERRDWDAGKIQDEDENENEAAGSMDEPHELPYRQQNCSSASRAKRGSAGRPIERGWRGPENGLLKQFRSALG